MIKKTSKLLYLGILMCTILNGCVGKNHNNIPRKSIDEVTKGNKAMIIMQTTAIVPPGNILFNPYSKAIELDWCTVRDGAIISFDITSGKNILSTKNYRPLYLGLEVSDYITKGIELYVINPGLYMLSNMKYLKNTNIHMTRDFNPNLLKFKVDGGEVLYLGNLTIDMKNNRIASKHFPRKALSIGDNFEKAKSYLNKRHPALAPKLQKRLIKLTKVNK